MSRSIKIILYFITFLLFIFFSGILMVRASYMIPVDISGVEFERSYNFTYITIFGIIAFMFGIMAAFAFLTKLGKMNIKDIFAYKKRYLVYSTSVVAFGLFYFVFELLFGYIVLNINNPYSKVNNTYNSIVVADNKVYDELDYSIRSDNTNMFILNGTQDVTFMNSLINHYGNGQLNEYDNNTIIKAVRDSSLYVNDSLFNLRGKNSEGFYIDTSSLNIKSSEIRVDDPSSIVLYAANSDISIFEGTFSAYSNELFIFRNSCKVLFGKSKFNINENVQDLIYLYSDSVADVNTIDFKEMDVDLSSADLFRIDKSTDIITIEDSSISIDDINKYLLSIHNSNVELHIKNSTVKGNITFDDNSKVKIVLENSSFNGDIISSNTIELIKDDSSTFVTNNTTLQNLNNSDELNNENQESE